MKKLLSIVFVCIVCEAFSQTKYSTTSDDFNAFHATISNAERMYKNDSVLNAYAQYDMAFDNYKGSINPSHFFKATLCALKIKEDQKAINYLEKAITNGYEIDSNKMGLIVFNNQATAKEYKANIGKWVAQRDNNKNATWENELYTSREESKKYYTGAYKIATEACISCLKNKTCNKTTPEYLSKYKLVKEKMKADSIEAVKLLSKIQLYGFPTIKLVDKVACQIARNILLNYDLDKKNERLDNILYKALINGHVSPSFYAQVIDRRNLMNSLPLEFYEPIDGNEKIVGKDLTIANSKRKTIGLHNIIIPKNVKNPKEKVLGVKTDNNVYDY